MKRTLATTLMALVLCVCMVFGLTACGGFTQDDIDNAVNEATVPLISQITAHEADIADKETEIDSLEGEKAILTTEKTELLADIEEIEAEVAALEAEVAALKQEKASLTADKATLEASITAKDNEIANLNSSISALETEKSELEKENAELEIRINCLEGKHVINETETISYVYTWSETAPTSTKNYTCLHCGKAIEETVSPSVWSVGDEVTYVAKDGNSYVSTVGEATDEKAVIVCLNIKTKSNASIKTEEQCLALLEPVGARWPHSNEVVWETFFKPAILKTSQAYFFTFVYDVENSMYLRACFLNVDDEDVVHTYSGFNDMKHDYFYYYVWDIPITTAE